MPNDLPIEPKYISIRTAADFLNVSIDTLRRWDKQGILKAHRPNGKDRVFLVTDLERFKYAHPLQVSEAADLLGISISTLRRLESRGKLIPQRDSNGRRIYNFADLARFAKNVPSDNVPVTQSEVKLLTKDAVAARIEVDTILRRVRRVRRFVATLALFVIISITTLTILFLLYPVQTAEFFELRETQYVSRGVVVNRSVLGATTSDEGFSFKSLLTSLLRPLAQTSLNLVSQIDEEKYVIATNGGIIETDLPLTSISSSSVEINNVGDFKITDNSVVQNLNAELLGGRRAGSEPGNLVVIDENGRINPDLIDSSQIDVSFTIEDRSVGGAQIALDTIENENLADDAVTSNKIEDGTISSSDIADNAFITAKIADNAITGAKIDNGTITTSDLSEGLTFSSSTLLNLSQVTHGSTTPQGLILPNASSATPSDPSTGEGYLAWDTAGNQLIVYDGSSWGTLAGTGDITGVTAGSGVTGGGASGGVTLNVGAGNGITVNADDIAINLATSGTTGGTSSNSGLEVGSGGLSLLKGCSDNQILKWTDAGGWACNNDTGSGSTVSVEEGDSSVTATLSTLDFLASEFIVQDSPSGEANISIDYVNSGITRVNQGQVITGGWTFNTAATTFTTDIIANGGITLSSGETIANGTNSTITLGRNDAGTVTLNARDDDATAALTVLPGGAAALTLGGSSTTGITLVTDSTGDSEVVLPGNSIGNSELVNSGLTFAGNSGSGSIALGGTLTIVGAGINNAVYSGGTVTITGTEADTLSSVTSRGATTSNALTLSSTSNAVTVGTLTISGDAFTDLTGTGLTISGGALNTTLGVAIDSSEITDATIANGDIANDTIDLDKVSDTLTLDAATSITASGALGLTIGNNVTLSATGTGAITATDLSCTDCISATEIGALTLGTDTAGNYVATITGGAGLTGSGSTEGSTPTLAVGAGTGITVNADDIAVNLSSSGTTGSTSSNSGLEVGSGGLSLLKGCSDNEILKWTDAGGWACATDTSGSGSAAVQEGDSGVVASISTLDFLAADFVVSESPSGEANISLDYANSGITRVGQSEIVTGGWTFNTAATTFTTAIDVNSASTVAGLIVDGNGNLSISNGSLDGALSLSGTTSDNALQVGLTNGTSAGTQNIAYLDNAASNGTTESILVIDNSDTDTAVTNAIEFVNAGGGFTNLFNVAGTTISSTEFTLLDGRDTALVDTTDAVSTAITGTGTLTAGATGAGFTINFGTSTLSGDITSANISGIDISADTNLSASNGVTLTGDALSLSSLAGGDGLTYATGVLAVGAGAGISVAADSISATLGTSIANAEIDDDVINFDKIANALTLDEGTTITAGGALGLTIGNNVTLSATGTGAITATDLSCADCINGTEIGDLTLGTDTAGNYVATITGGAGLTGSGSSEGSTPTIAVGAGNGITVNADDITIALTASGTTGSTASNSGLEVGSGGLSLLKGCTDTEILKWTDAGGWACAADETGGGGFTSFTAAGDSGGGQTIADGNSLSILGGTNGIDTVDSATDTITLSLDTTEIGTTTFGSGSGITWTFNAGATDPTIAFGSDTIDFTAGTTTLSGNLTVSGGTILGAATSNLLNSVTTTLNFGGAVTTLNIADGATTKTIDIGGVTADGTDTINIATNATSADVISIGNGNGFSSVSLTSGDSWAISANGVLTLSADSSQATAIVATDSDYTNFASIADNNIVGTTAAIDLTNFDVASTGALTLVGGLSPDITTQSNNALTIQPGGTGAIVFNSSNTSASAIDINATGTVAGNAFTLDTTNGGIALTAGGASNGDITILSTDDLSINGTAGSLVNIGTSAVTQTITIGASSNTDLVLADAQWSVTGAGVGTFVSGTVLGSQTFTTNNIVDSGALTIKSATGANALTLDSGSTGTVNLGTSNNAKTINIGTGTQGNTISLGTNNTTSDTISIGSALDNISIASDSWSITDAGVLTVSSCSGCGGGGGTLQQAYSGDADGSNAIILTDSTDGSVIIQTVAGTQFQVAATAAPTVDLASITNTGQGVTSTSGVDGLSITYVQATDAGAITGSGLDVTLTPSGDASDVIRGITLDNVTSGSSTETGLYIGTGYDRDLEFADSTPTIRSADGAVLSFTDGTNTLAAIKDQGTYAFLNITPKGTATDPATCAVGDVYVNSSDATIKACTGTDTWEALDGGGGGGTKVVTLHPEFPGATLTANGSATINGTMTSDVTGSADGWKNFYEWNSSQTSLQDYTVAVRFKLPSDFSSWATSNAIVVNYVTESTSNTNNKIDIDIRNEDDTPGTTVTTSSANVSGVAATWTSVAIDDSAIDDGGAPDLDAAGEDAILLIKLYSKDSNYARIGDIVLTYTAQ